MRDKIHPEADEVLSLITQRSEFLAVLHKSPMSPQELTSQIDVSRSTVSRALSTLEEHQIVAKESGKYKLTPFGQLAWNTYQDFEYELEHITNAAGFLAHLPNREELFSKKLFTGAEMNYSSTKTPNGAIRELASKISEFESVNILLSVILPIDVELYLEDMANETEDARIVVDKSVCTRLSSEQHSIISTLRESSSCSLYSVTHRIPFCLFLLGDSEIWIRFHDERANILGTLSNDSKEAIERADKIFTRYLPSNKS